MYKMVHILGAYGAKSTKGGSSSILVNEQNVIDAGNLLVTLKEESIYLHTVWLTHSHLDHIVDLAYILDNYYEKRTQSLKIMALSETIDALKNHFFNNKIWPDFSTIPLVNSQEMTIVYETIKVGKEYMIGQDKTIEAFLGDHSVASVGYILREEEQTLLISADTHSLAHIVKLIEEDNSIKTLIVECSFPIHMESLAKKSKHLTAKYLFDGLKRLENKEIRLYINHLKPEYEQVIRDEIESLKGTWDTKIIQEGDEIRF